MKEGERGARRRPASSQTSTAKKQKTEYQILGLIPIPNKPITNSHLKKTIPCIFVSLVTIYCFPWKTFSGHMPF